MYNSAHRFGATSTAKHMLLILGALIVLLPFYVMVTNSFKSPSEIMLGTGGVFGSQKQFQDDYCVAIGNLAQDCMVTPIIDNYVTAFEKAPLLRYLINGVIVTLSIFFIQERWS